jgi:hypothetical protein
MRTSIATLPAALVLAACAIVPGPVVVPSAAGRPTGEVSRLVAASDARLFPCYIHQVQGADGASLDLGRPGTEVTLPPGRYRVILHCTNNAGHSWHPDADVAARAGKRYQVTGYFIDDSITIFNMKMRVRVAELP